MMVAHVLLQHNPDTLIILLLYCVLLSDPDWFVLGHLSQIIIESADRSCISNILSPSHDCCVTLPVILSVTLSVFTSSCFAFVLIPVSSASYSLHFPPFFLDSCHREREMHLKGLFAFAKSANVVWVCQLFWWKSLFSFFFFFACLSLRDGYHILLFLLPTLDQHEKHVTQRV